jgi:hypothetical protein
LLWRVSRWRDRFLEEGKKALTNGASDDHACRGEIENLQKIIGKKAIQIEILKKAEGQYWGIDMTEFMVTSPGWVYLMEACSVALEREFPDGVRGGGLKIISDNGSKPTKDWPLD